MTGSTAGRGSAPPSCGRSSTTRSAPTRCTCTATTSASSASTASRRIRATAAGRTPSPSIRSQTVVDPPELRLLRRPLRLPLPRLRAQRHVDDGHHGGRGVSGALARRRAAGARSAARPPPSAATRPIQAFDQPVGFAPVWTPRDVTAQPGDTIRWQFDQPGNANAAGASHDLHLSRPGARRRETGRRATSTRSSRPPSTTTAPTRFYCSIHPDSMRGADRRRGGRCDAGDRPGPPVGVPRPAGRDRQRSARRC